MSWRIVYISEAEEMKLYLDNLKVIKDNQEYLIPLSDIHSIIVDNIKTTVTAKLINKLSEYHILLIFCDETHNPNMFCLGLYSHYKVYGMLYKQLEWNEKIKGEMWKKIIQIKINNQATVLKYLNKNTEVIERLFSLAKSVEIDDVTNREGIAASIYFKELFNESFKRERNSLDAYNSALNYGYIVLRSCLARTIAAHGLHPAMGIGHRSQYNAFNLVDDCMEVYRPVIDLWVAKNIKPTDFLTREKKQEIVNRLNAKISIGGQKQTVLNSIELYIQSFISAMNSRDIDLLVYPSDGIAI